MNTKPLTNSEQQRLLLAEAVCQYWIASDNKWNSDDWGNSQESQKLWEKAEQAIQAYRAAVHGEGDGT